MMGSGEAIRGSDRPIPTGWSNAAILGLMFLGAILAWRFLLAAKHQTGALAHAEGPTRAPSAPQVDHEESEKPTTRQPEPTVDPYADKRRRMVETQMRGRDIVDPRVLAAMGRVRRHEFVPKHLRWCAYADQPLSIGHGQTISQPYIVSLMTQAVKPTAQSKALDVGTGSGYQAAVLAEICQHVYSVEIVKELAESARARLSSLGYDNVTVRHGDGYRGWPEHAPFDVIIAAAAPDHIPRPLLDQLAPGGRLVIPVGRYAQELILVAKGKDGRLTQKSIVPVAFVPMTGEAQRNRD